MRATVMTAILVGATFGLVASLFIAPGATLEAGTVALVLAAQLCRG